MLYMAKKLTAITAGFGTQINKKRIFEIPVKVQTFKDYAALAAATCGGIGFIPFIPATWGSLFGAIIFAFAQENSRSVWLSFLSEAQASAIVRVVSLILLTGLFFIGIRCADRIEKISETKDAKFIVIDELLGITIMYLLLPKNLSLKMIAAGFITFRVFDILKPYPIKELENLPGGLGIVADDVLAGVYAAVCLSITIELAAFF
jgi:phosphatidylglycerophosphatase A